MLTMVPRNSIVSFVLDQQGRCLWVPIIGEAFAALIPCKELSQALHHRPETTCQIEDLVYPRL